jgi:hypothetical protein
MAPSVIGTNVAGDKYEYDPGNWIAKTSAHNNVNGAKGTIDGQFPERHPETGINVLIVGAGMGGLMTTLECWRKGHNIVGILERNDGPVYSGIYHLICPIGNILWLTAVQEISSSYSPRPSQS